MELAGHTRRDPGLPARNRLKALACAVVVVLCLWAVQLARLHCSTEHGCHSKASQLLNGSATLPRSKLPGRASAGLSLLPTGQDLCASALEVVPRVAMLFLTRGEIWHEAMWREWFRSAAGLVPAAAVRASNCSAEVFDDMAAWCRPPSDAVVDVIGAQHLFSVYVHTQPDFEGFAMSSPFFGRELPVHVRAAWGSFDLMDATKELLRAALRDERNAKMVMLSESCIPLYPPTLTYQQLISEPLSRVNACPNQGTMPWRWHPRMARGDRRVRVPPRLWRKSSQWVALARPLARIVAEDVAIAEIFRTSCYETDWDEELGGHYECYSDEHYLPVTLAFHGKADETDCLGYTTDVKWAAWGGPHPMSYNASDITAQNITSMRKPDKCDPAAALKLSSFMFVRAGSAPSTELCEEDSPWSHRILHKECPLFSRKFPNHTAAAVEALLTDCSSGLGITRCQDKQARALRSSAHRADRRSLRQLSR